MKAFLLIQQIIKKYQMRLNLVITLFLIVLTSICYAQQEYTTELYAYDSLMNVKYGSAVNHNAEEVDLLLDIFKPKGDDNCKRPIVVLVHGGAWIAGSKADNNIKFMARSFAKRGWVVAAINYRLGTHKAANYTMYALCNSDISAPCGYAADSAEIYRANYRGMQDAKGAIRFMKNRFAEDSSDVDNAFIVGESAGAFIALATSFTDLEEEKHPSCAAIADAPIPSNNLAPYGCNSSPLTRTRPDLGNIHGTLNLGAFDAKVKGVGAFYGGLFNLSIIQETSLEKPVVYMFHQGSDVVVDYRFNRLLGRINWECYAQLNLCQQYFFMPYAHGSKNVTNYLDNMSQAPVYQAEIIENYSYMNDCFSNGHEILNRNLRVQNMVNLFAQRIAESENNPTTNCVSTHVEKQAQFKAIQIFPNPANEELHLSIPNTINEMQYVIIDQLGIIVMEGTLNQQHTILAINHLPKGVYVFKLNHPQHQAQRFIKL